jgi:hypothetical protein
MSVFDKETTDKAARASLNPFIEKIPQEIYSDMVASVSRMVWERQMVVLCEVHRRITAIGTEFAQTVKAVDAHISEK